MLDLFEKLQNGGGFWVFIHFVLALWAIISIFQNETRGNLSKAFWAALVFFVPGLGLVVWFFFGPKSPKKLG